MYLEELMEFLYEEQMKAWYKGGKKGTPPVHPKELQAKEEERINTEAENYEPKTENLPDIMSIGVL